MSSRASRVPEPISRNRAKIQRDMRRHSAGFDQLPVLDPVAERRAAAHPHALHAAGAELVADALGRHLPLELGEGEQHVEGQPAHRGRGVKVWVTETKVISSRSNTSTILAKSMSERVRRSIL